jgi:hypothetical protein
VLYYCRKNSDYRSGRCIANFSILLTCCIQLYYVVVNFAISKVCLLHAFHHDWPGGLLLWCVFICLHSWATFCLHYF